MQPKVLKFAIDDGSTNVKISWIDNGTVHSVTSPNSFRKNWKSSALINDKKVFNYTIGPTKYTFDATSDKALSTTHVAFQYEDLNLLSVHHALLQTGFEPCQVSILVTLPITEYYNADDCQKNEVNIARKKANLMREISLNKGETFDIVDVEVLPESLPAVLTSLVDSGVNQFTKSLVIDVGGTTLDMGVIVGEFEEVSSVYGNTEIGVSMVTNAARKALASSDSDASYLVANELIKRRNDRDFANEVINDVSKIDWVLECIDNKITELGDAVAYEAKTFIHNPNRVYLVGGGAILIEHAVRSVYPSLSDKIILLDKPQEALSREICCYHVAEPAGQLATA